MKQLSTRSMLSTDSPDMSRLSSYVKLTLRRRVALFENGSGRFAGRSDSWGEESMGLRARIVEPALAALTLLDLDGMDVSLMVDLDLCFVV
jgi:hypothetical protein